MRVFYAWFVDLKSMTKNTQNLTGSRLNGYFIVKEKEMIQCHENNRADLFRHDSRKK